MVKMDILITDKRYDGVYNLHGADGIKSNQLIIDRKVEPDAETIPLKIMIHYFMVLDFTRYN